MIFYFAFNLVSGERGLFSYNDKKDLLSNLKKEELLLTNKIQDLDHKKPFQQIFRFSACPPGVTRVNFRSNYAQNRQKSQFTVMLP